MCTEQYIINGKVFDRLELEESFAGVWRQLRSAAGVRASASAKVRAAKFCLACADTDICSARTAAAVRKLCGGILKLAAKGDK